MDIPFDRYEASVAEYVKEDQNVALFGDQLYDVMLNLMPSYNKPVEPTPEYVAEVHKFMVDQYHRIQYRPLRTEHFTDVKERMLYDRLYQKFEIEEEDIRALQKNFDSPAVQEAIAQVSAALQKDEETFGSFAKK